ncbi:MAG: T9SS type B sorting domain-containing protein [Paludibacteraceae bacterium]|nr:T9SS type B sorting domain-containing protein [Paludibacteraceae bacterium]
MSWMRVLLFLFFALSFPCANFFPAWATDCSNGSIIYRADFGGNNVEDPVAKGSGIPECSGYSYDDNPVDYSGNGKYAIRKVAISGHYEWYNDIVDHTYPSDKNRGYFMQVDASHLPCEFYRAQIDNVCGGTEMYASLYGASTTKRSGDLNGTIRMIVEDATSGVEIDHYDVEMQNSQNGKWVQYGFSFVIPAGCSSIVYRIVNNADPSVISGGNDFCLDDIEIRACLPLPTITPKKGTTICLGESETLTGDMDNTINLTLPLTFTWYKCDSLSYNMADWKEVYTGKSLGLYNVTADDAGFYKVMVSGAGQTPNLNACSCLSEFYELVVSDCGSHRPQPCPDGTLLFKEDFGGNSVSDPSVKKEAIPQCSYEFGEDPRDSEGIGKYSIRKVGIEHNQWYRDIYDHTYPDDSDRGYFMQVDASAVSGIFYQTEITGLCENSELYMSMWGMSSTTTGFWANAYLKLIVEDLNGNVLQSSNIEIENAKGFWEQFGLTYVVPSGQNSVIFKIVNNSNTNRGNDFCLDDIEVRLCNPPISLASPDSLCPGSDVTLSADFVNDGTYAEPVTLTWYKCDTISYEPSDWTLVGSGTSLDFHNVSEADEGYYRVWASGNGASQLISKCNSASDFAKISLKVCESCVDTTVELFDTIALGNAYSKNGFNIPSPILGENVDTLKLQTSKGCDSTVSLKLYVYKNTSDTIRIDICQGTTYQKYGFNESTAGTYTQQLRNSTGGDSLVTLVLEVLPTYDDTIAQTIIQGDSYTFAGNTYDAAGLYTVRLQTVSGCDSIVTLSLTVLSGSSDTIRASICSGASYQAYGFDESAAGTYTQQLKNVSGADSLVTLVLEVLPTYDDTVSQTIIQGDSYTFLGNTYDTEGLYTTRLQTVAGCDSFVTLNLSVISGSSDTIRASICSGASYQENGFDENIAGTYTQQLKNVSGADSLVTLVLEVLPTYDDTVSQTIIQGDSYTFLGNTYDTEGLYTTRLQTVAGCDSFVTLNLSVISGSSDTIRASICSDASYQENGFDENIAGTYTQRLKNVSGADSLVTLVLEVLPTYNDTIAQTIIQGDSYTFAGNTYDAAGLYTVRLQTVSGCDSIVTLNLSVLNGSSDTIRASICSGAFYQAYGFDESAAGIYTQQLKNVSGADSLVTLVLEVLPTYDDTIRDAFCAGETYSQHGFNVSAGGVYRNEGTSVYGCDSIVTLILEELPSYTMTINDTICEGDSYDGNGFDIPDPEEGTTTHTLTFLPTYGCDSVVTLSLCRLPLRHTAKEFIIQEGETAVFGGETYVDEGEYHQVVRSSNSCEDIEIVVKFRESKEETDTFSFVEIIPSEILVRGGGQDNRWHVENIELYPQAVVSIYDRWGKKLFEINDYNDATGWDGTYNGYAMPSTDYWYMIDVHEIDRVYVGHFTLIRW